MFMLLAALSAVAPDAQTPAAAPAPKSAEKKICRTEETLGSIMRKKTCRTAAEWEQIRVATEKAADRRRSTGSPVARSTN